MYHIINSDCIEWMSAEKTNSITAIVTDPPYAFQEYTDKELEKKRNGQGGIWRIPPNFDGYQRQALPRFSVINDDEKSRQTFAVFFENWGKCALRVLVPGAHLIIASTPLLSDVLGCSLRSAGFERRGEIVRLVSTLRGGDRPKGAEKEFAECSVMPRAGWEPWGIYRKPLAEKTVAQNLRKWGAGALRRPASDVPFSDVISVGRTPKAERSLSRHPNQKPLLLLQQLTKAAIPLGEGILLDTFLGSGTTLAAAEFNKIESIGIEKDDVFYQQAQKSIPSMLEYMERESSGKRTEIRYRKLKNPAPVSYHLFSHL